jgi:hypothetical protein
MPGLGLGVGGGCGVVQGAGPEFKPWHTKQKTKPCQVSLHLLIYFAKQALYHLSHTFSPFYSGYFGDAIFQTVCLGWPQTSILTITASQKLGL